LATVEALGEVTSLKASSGSTGPLRDSTVSWRFPHLIAVDQSQIDALVRIHFQEEYRGASDVRETDDSAGPDSEMIGPLIVSRMKQGHQRIAIRIAAGQVGSLEQIAMVAGECEIPDLIGAAMLFGDDVLHMIGMERLPGLPHPTLFAASRRPGDHESAA
jgi:hypothetical protein